MPLRHPLFAHLPHLLTNLDPYNASKASATQMEWSHLVILCGLACLLKDLCFDQTLSRGHCLRVVCLRTCPTVVYMSNCCIQQ